MGKDHSLSNESLLAWQICLTIFHSIAIGFTLTRLVHRWRTRKIWWDDYLVLLPLVTDVMYISISWTMYSNSPFSQDSGEYRSFLFSGWFSVFMYFTIVWISRISLALSLARTFDAGHICRRFAFCLAVGFTLIYLATVLVNTFTCRLGPTWYKMRRCQEISGRSLGIVLAIGFDFLSDFLLIVSPLVMLRNVKLPPTRRPFILCLFSSSILTLLTSVMFSVTWYIAPENNSRSLVLMNMTALLQVASCLLVCNLVILTKLFYKAFLKKKIGDDEDGDGDQGDRARRQTTNSMFPRSPSYSPSPPQRARTFWRSRSPDGYPGPEVRQHPLSTSISRSSRYTPITLTSIDDESMWTSFGGSVKSWMVKPLSILSTHDSQTSMSVPSWNFTIRSGRERLDPEAGAVAGGSNGWDDDMSKGSANSVK